MHLHARRARRLALALAIPIVGLGAIALSANAAISATTVAIQPTDQPDGGATDGGGGGTPTNGGGGNTPTGPAGTSPPNPSQTPTHTPSPTPTPTSKSPTVSPSKSATGGGGGGAACAKPLTGPTTVKVATVNGRQALVDNSGCSLYQFTSDSADASACDAQCLTTWWPAPAPGTAGSGIQQANLGIFTRANGFNQVTYYGHQLYRYSADTAPGEAKGQGLNQSWYLVDPSGNPITG